MTKEERAKFWHKEMLERAEDWNKEWFYIQGATDQKKIDIEKAYEALYTLMNDYDCDLKDIEQAKENNA